MASQLPELLAGKEENMNDKARLDMIAILVAIAQKALDEAKTIADDGDIRFSYTFENGAETGPVWQSSSVGC